MRSDQLARLIGGTTYYPGRYIIGTSEPVVALGYRFVTRGQDITIPVILVEGEEFSFEDNQEVALYKPLAVASHNPYESKKRTVITTIRTLYNNTSFLKKVVTNKDVVYYGLYGTIFDQNLNPLYLRAWRFAAVDDVYHRVSEVNLISHLAFQRDDMICKALRKDFIIYGMENNVDTIVTDLSSYLVHAQMYSPVGIHQAVEGLSDVISENLQ